MKQESSNLEKVVSAFALLAVGVCFVVWADKVTEWIAIALGVLALIAACVHAAKFFKTKPEDRTTSGLLGVILFAAIGILLVSRADFVKGAISFIIGIYIILSCSLQLMSFSGLRRATGIRSRFVVWPIIGVVIGILCITGQFIIPDALATLTGVALIIYAIVYLFGLFSIEKTAKESIKKVERKQIAEAVIVKESKATEAKVKPKSKK